MRGIKRDSKQDQLEHTAFVDALTSQAQRISVAIPTATGLHATAHLGSVVLLGTGTAGLAC